MESCLKHVDSCREIKMSSKDNELINDYLLYKKKLDKDNIYYDMKSNTQDYLKPMIYIFILLGH